MNDQRDPLPFGKLLRRHREASGLSQEALAARSGVSEDAIGLLERGQRVGPRSQTVRLLALAMRLDARDRAEFEASAERGRAGSDTRRNKAERTIGVQLPTDFLPPRAYLPVGSRMPLAPNPLFVGRGEELLQVAAALGSCDTTVVLGQVVASTGLGGLGKTQLAVEFVHRYDCFFAGGVFWLSFASVHEIPLQVAACADPGFGTRSLGERVGLVQSAWQSATPRLLVFDNCEEESLLETWRPTSGGCRVLVTSRRSTWSPTLGVAALPLDLLPRPDSIELLHRYRPDLAPHDPRLDSVAGKLGDLPLALHLAGRYLLGYRAEVSLDEYLAEMEQPELIGHASLLGEGLDDSPSPTHHVQSLAKTFALCLGRLDRQREVDRVAIMLLARMAWLAPGEAVPRELLGRTLEQAGPRRYADGLRRLGAVGLVEEGEGWLRLHRLLAHFVRQEGLDPDARPAVARALVGCGEDAERGRLTGTALVAVIPHLIEMAGPSGSADEQLPADLCTAAGRALRHAGDLRAARPFYERAVIIRERALGPDHLDNAEGLNNLAVVLKHQGESAAARLLYERALAIRERALGDHPDTALILNNQGALLRDQGELAAARPLFERVLAIWEHALGPDHPATAEALNNLGALLRDQGELAAAQPLLERALDIRKRVLGAGHSLTAVSENDLGSCVRLAWRCGHSTLRYDAGASAGYPLGTYQHVITPITTGPERRPVWGSARCGASQGSSRRCWPPLPVRCRRSSISGRSSLSSTGCERS